MRTFILAVVFFFGFTSQLVKADELVLQNSAPDRYVVVKGDTLWDISGRFLKQPWRWPEIWNLNRDEIKNPHWIYPGDVVVLDRSGATPRLRLLKSEKYGSGSVSGRGKLSPQIRSEPYGTGALPSISPAAIEPFLSKPLVTDDKDSLTGNPYIVATDGDRVILGTGNTAYVRGLKEQDGAFWQIFRPGKALVDPDSQETLGYEAIYLGEARVTQFGEPATIEVTKSTQEITIRDRLALPPPQTSISYVPHAPTQPIEGRVISVYGGVAEAGQNDIVSISKGLRDGIEVGHVLALYRRGKIAKPLNGESEGIKLPDERYGLLFVFRTFEKLSYGLVVQTSRPVKILDTVRTP